MNANLEQVSYIRNDFDEGILWQDQVKNAERIL